MPGVYTIEYESGKMGVEFTEDALEKFAELIVQECMSCATWVGRANTNTAEPINTAHAINKRIQQRLGVNL